jgi:hypothetical protein
MRESGKVAIAKVVLRSKEQLVAIRPQDELLCMETMIFADEVVSHDSIDELPAASDLKASARELKMAQQLIDSLSTDWEPEKYRDEYREKVLELIERKAAGEEIAVQPEAPQPAKVPDLMAALEASLAAVKGDADGEAPKKKSGAKKPARERRPRRSRTARAPPRGHSGNGSPASCGLLGTRGSPASKRGRGFAYYDSDGGLVDDPAVLARIRELAIPPAWRDVWVCPHPNGHLQATGLDDRGRKQYRYHDEWRRRRDQEKFDDMVRFAHRPARAA